MNHSPVMVRPDAGGGAGVGPVARRAGGGRPWAGACRCSTVSPPVSAVDRVERVVQLRRQISRLEALERRVRWPCSTKRMSRRTYQPMPAAGSGSRRTGPCWPSWLVACRVAKPTMAGRITEADLIVHAFPATLAALAGGTHRGRPCPGDRRPRRPDRGRRAPGPLRTTRPGTCPDGDPGPVDELRSNASPPGSARCASTNAIRWPGTAGVCGSAPWTHGMSELYFYVATAIATPIWVRLTQQANAITHNPSTTRWWRQRQLATGSEVAAKLTVTVAATTVLRRGVGAGGGGIGQLRDPRSV